MVWNWTPLHPDSKENRGYRNTSTQIDGSQHQLCKTLTLSVKTFARTRQVSFNHPGTTMTANLQIQQTDFPTYPHEPSSPISLGPI